MEAPIQPHRGSYSPLCLDYLQPLLCEVGDDDNDENDDDDN